MTDTTELGAPLWRIDARLRCLELALEAKRIGAEEPLEAVVKRFLAFVVDGAWPAEKADG